MSLNTNKCDYNVTLDWKGIFFVVRFVVCVVLKIMQLEPNIGIPITNTGLPLRLFQQAELFTLSGDSYAIFTVDV